MKDVHICPILMRTVIWIDGKCQENCDEEDCPIQVLIRDSDNSMVEQVIDAQTARTYYGP